MKYYPYALFGLETAYVTRLYLLRTALVAGLILVLVLALDLAGNSQSVLTAQGVATVPEGSRRLAYYVMLRAQYNLPSILPLALAIGILWSEIRLTRGHERAMIANTGRAPLLSMVPALLVGLVIGSAQYVLFAHARPHAVEAQAEAGFRYYGPRFNRGTSHHVWNDFDGALVNAAIQFTPDGPVLIDLRLFVLDRQNRLERAVWADRAYPVAGGLALAGQVARWPVDPAADSREALVINPDWLAWARVEPRLVPQPVLRRIAEAEEGVPGQTAYQAALLERSAAIAGAIAMALMVASLCLHWMTTRRGLMVPVAILAAAYFLQLADNTFSVLGEYGRLGPVAASWSLPVAVLIACLVGVVANHWSVTRRLRTLRPEE